MALCVGQHALFAAEPHTHHEPNRDNRKSDKTDSAQSQSESVESAIRPCANLIAHTVRKSVDHTFGFVFVFTPQNREQYFARRTHERERGRAPQDLKYCQYAKQGRDADDSKSD